MSFSTLALSNSLPWTRFQGQNFPYLTLDSIAISCFPLIVDFHCSVLNNVYLYRSLVLILEIVHSFTAHQAPLDPCSYAWMGWLSTTIGDGVGIASDDLFLHFKSSSPPPHFKHVSYSYKKADLSMAAPLSTNETHPGSIPGQLFFKLCVYVVDYRHHWSIAKVKVFSWMSQAAVKVRAGQVRYTNLRMAPDSAKKIAKVRSKLEFSLVSRCFSGSFKGS